MAQLTELHLFPFRLQDKERSITDGSRMWTARSGIRTYGRERLIGSARALAAELQPANDVGGELQGWMVHGGGREWAAAGKRETGPARRRMVGGAASATRERCRRPRRGRGGGAWEGLRED